MPLYLFLTIGFGITNAIVFLHIFGWLRKVLSGVDDGTFQRLAACKRLPHWRARFLGRLVRCHACMGFWIGMFLYVFLYLATGDHMIEIVLTRLCIVNAVLCGFIQSAANFILWVFLRRFGAEEI